MSPAENDVILQSSVLDTANDATFIHPSRSIAGEEACLRVWERIRHLDPQAWLALPCAKDVPDSELALLLESAGSGAAVPYIDIAREAERALEHGVRSTTPLALVLLAAIALDCSDHGNAAVQLGHIALQMAVANNGPQSSRVRALHIALILPYTDDLNRMVESLSEMRQAAAVSPLIGVCAAGTFIAGTPLPELARQLDDIQRMLVTDGACAASATELSARLVFLRSLLSCTQSPAVSDQEHTVETRHEAGFGYWLAQLQTAWYACNRTLAVQALDRGKALMGPLTPVLDRLTFHLFAVLALAGGNNPATSRHVHQHSGALQKWASKCPVSGSAMAELANAICNHRTQDRMAALRGVEKAAAIAVCHGQHWIAAMAWEQAVHLAQECGFTSAVQHYRQQTLTSYQNWGAFGRVDMLRREWNEAEVRLAGVQNAENERAVRVGAVGEPRLAIAHEVNQPLAAITLHAAAARKWLRRPQPDIERALSSLSLISAAGRYAGDIVRSVQRLASRQENELHDVTVDQTIGDALQLLHQPLRRHGIEIELALGLGACTIRASRVQLQQVVMNLLMNAIEALATGGAGQRRIRLESRRDTDHVEVLVSDNGPGILDADRDRVFTSMFSTKPKNTGMGLSISLSIIRAHGGQLVFNPCHPHGACFRFRLPMNLDQKLPLSTDRAAN